MSHVLIVTKQGWALWYHCHVNTWRYFHQRGKSTLKQGPLNYLFICVWSFCRCACMHNTHVWFPRRLEDGIRSPQTRATDRSCRVGVGNQTRVLWKRGQCYQHKTIFQLSTGTFSHGRLGIFSSDNNLPLGLGSGRCIWVQKLPHAEILKKTWRWFSPIMPFLSKSHICISDPAVDTHAMPTKAVFP